MKYRNLSKYSTVVLLLVISTVSSAVQQVFDSGKSTPGAVHRGKRAPADPERVPLLYDYYSGALSNGYDKRNFDEIDRGMFDRWLLKKAYDNVGSLIDEAARRDESFTYGKRNFDEIDRSAFNGFNKRLPFGTYLLNSHKDDSNPDKKRNFDEIDRAGFHGFKRNFDEIDRVGFNHLKKKNFDEIDRVGFHGFKRNV